MSFGSLTGGQKAKIWTIGCGLRQRLERGRCRAPSLRHLPLRANVVLNLLTGDATSRADVRQPGNHPPSPVSAPTRAASRAHRKRCGHNASREASRASRFAAANSRTCSSSILSAVLDLRGDGRSGPFEVGLTQVFERCGEVDCSASRGGTGAALEDGGDEGFS